MAGSGLGAAREAMLQEYLSNWISLHAPKHPVEIGGQSLISGVCLFMTRHHKNHANDPEAERMYRYLRIALKEVTDHIEWLDQSTKESKK